MSDVEGMAAIIFDSFSRNHSATQAAERLSAAGYGSKTEAWDEGFTKAGRLLTGLDHDTWPPTPNPYRADEVEGK